MNAQTPVEIHLPFGLTDEQLNLGALCSEKRPVVLSVPADFDELLDESNGTFGEVFAIQRVLTLVRSRVPLCIRWAWQSIEALVGSAATHPLVAVLVSVEGAQHRSEGTVGEAELNRLLISARKSLAQYRLRTDFFSDRQIVLCADSRGHSYPPDLYEIDASLKSREDYEGLIQDILIGQLANISQTTASYRFSAALGLIVAELFENTHVHGRFDLAGGLLKPDAMRGLVFKRIKLDLPVSILIDGRSKMTTKVTECLEISVFDTGMGYFQSFTREPLGVATDIGIEWKVLHNCLERHHDPEIADVRASHRGMGLAEVLRALQQLHGRIEIRTGRLFAQRTFLPGELQAQMEKLSSPLARQRQPKPRMLDFDKKYVAIPTTHDPVVGTAVRVIVPLW